MTNASKHIYGIEFDFDDDDDDLSIVVFL